MSFVSLKSAFISGLKAKEIKVECDIGRGINSFSLIGLGDKAVDESKDRVCSALRNTNFSNPKQVNQKTTISLAPGDIKKEGTYFDLPIALAYLLANKELKLLDENEIKESLFIGELSLRGDICKLKGVISITELAENKKIKNIFLPRKNAEEACLIKNINIFAVNSLKEITDHLSGIKRLKKENPINLEEIVNNDKEINDIDISDIKGQELAKRALLIAISGGHNIALYGPPGTGKTMLAKAARTLLPKLDYKSIIEVTKIHSISQKDDENEKIITTPPFRSPHHTSSYVSLVGGGVNLKPGEITLSHKGILFLDEFPEFEKRSIESLREPLEEGFISISRAKGSERFPANFILIAALNPCPCGNLGNKDKNCICRNIDINKYEKKLSGPIMDRIDIWVNVSNISYSELSKKENIGEKSIVFREKINKARSIMKERFKNTPNIEINSEMKARDLLEFINLEDKIKKEFELYATKLKLSPRVYHKTLKVARTIADLENKKDIELKHILESLQYRPKIKD